MKQKLNTFIEKDFEYDLILYKDIDYKKEKIPRRKNKKRLKEKKVKKINLKYLLLT